MNAKNKKVLLIVGIILDVVLTAFLLVVAVVMLATMPKIAAEIDTSTFIGYLQGNPVVYLLTNVLPLFLLLGINITALVWYVRKVANKKVALSDLNEEQKEALRKQLLAEMNKKPEDKSPEA